MHFVFAARAFENLCEECQGAHRRDARFSVESLFSVIQKDIAVEIGGEKNPRQVGPEQDGTYFLGRITSDGIEDDEEIEQENVDQAGQRITQVNSSFSVFR